MERHISRYVASSIPFHFCPAVYVSHQGMGGPSFLLLLALSPSPLAIISLLKVSAPSTSAV